jgi:hypothetical protein
VDSFPDLGSLTDQGLQNLMKELKAQERAIGELDEPEVDLTYKLRVLHGKLELVRDELVNRIRRQNESGDDLGGAGSSGVREPRRPSPLPGADGISLAVDEMPGDSPREPPTSQPSDR